MAPSGDEDGERGASPDGSRPARVFLSYSRTDIEHAKPVIALLEDAGLHVWWDGLLEGGENFLPTTEAALEGADCVVVLWTATSVNSHWVRDEAQSGRERRCLVPVSIDGTQSPLGFRQFQTIDASNWTGKSGTPEAKRLVSAVLAQCAACSGKKPRPAEAAPALAPAAKDSFTFSRRTLIGGTAATAGAAALGWLGYSQLAGTGADKAVALAVMPFENLSGDPEQVWFSNGLSSELRLALARNPLLRVTAPASSRIERDGTSGDLDLARELGVSDLLRGTVQLAGETARISVELVHAKDGVIRWADSFDRQLDDVFAVQSEIAQNVALSLVSEIAGQGEVQAALSEQEGVGGTRSVAAYEAYLRGLAFFDLASGDDVDEAALAQFDSALQTDPNFAAALAMRATMLSSLANKASGSDEVRRLYDAAIEASSQALAIAPDLAIGHQAKGFALNNGRLDRKAATPHYERALELAAGVADVRRAASVFFAYGSQTALARETINDVLKLDPLNARAFRTAGYIEWLARDFTEVIRNMREALKLNPQLVSAHYAIGIGHLMLGDAVSAQASFAQESVPLFSFTGEAMAQRMLGDPAAAKAAFQSLVEQYGDASLYQQAQIRAQWGDAEEAVTLLQQAYAALDPGLLFLPNDALLDPVRSKPAFRELQSRLSA